jgi:hypothetical protein
MGYTYRKYHVDENFFKRWTTDMAYCLGFILTDGNINFPSNHTSPRLRIASKDFDILNSIRGAMRSNHLIRKEKNRNGEWYQLSIYSERIVKDLNELGIHPCKSSKTLFPLMPTNFYPHFLRGVFDGDGCIYGRIPPKRKTMSLELSIPSGSEQFIKQFADIFVELTGWNHYGIRYREKGNIWEFRSSATGAIKFFFLIYQDPHIKLQRKYDKYKELISQGDRRHT